MTVSSQTSKAGPYNANGSQVVFPFGFKVFTKNDLRVVVTDANGAESDLDVDSDFTVALNADQNASPGGNVTTLTTYPVGYKVTIVVDMQLTQQTAITNFRPDVIERMIDKVTILIQQLAEQVGRSVKISVSSTSSPDQILEDMNALVFAAGQEANAAAGSATAAQNQANNAAAAAQAAADSAAEAAASVPAMADQAEAEAGTDNVKFMSALRVAQAIAVSLASDAETLAGLLASKAVTPAGLKSRLDRTVKTPTRAAGTTYTNTTGKERFISIRWQGVAGQLLSIAVDGTKLAEISGNAATSIFQTLYAIVPPGSSYVVTNTAGTIAAWYELD